MKDFYVYLHKKGSDNSVFYVGKGQGRRAYSKYDRTLWWKKTVAKHGYTVEIYMDGLQEWYALELEMDLIAYYGRRDIGLGSLINATDGGGGISGFKHSEETVKQISERSSGLGNPKADPNIYTFVHIHTKEETTSTRYEHEKKYGVSVNDIFGAKNILSMNGWCLKGNEDKVKCSDPTVYTFYHNDGDIFTGTRIQFRDKYGINIKQLFGVRAHRSFLGWTLEHNRNFRPGYDNLLHYFMNEDWEIFHGARWQFFERYGFKPNRLFDSRAKQKNITQHGWFTLGDSPSKEFFIFTIHNKFTNEVLDYDREEFEKLYPSVPTAIFSPNQKYYLKGWKVLEKRQYTPYNTCISVYSVL